MNPQPFSSLNHFTVPTATNGLLTTDDQSDPEETTYGDLRTKPSLWSTFRTWNLLTAYNSSRGRILDSPTQAHQFVAQAIGLGEVTSCSGGVAFFDQ